MLEHALEALTKTADPEESDEECDAGLQSSDNAGVGKVHEFLFKPSCNKNRSTVNYD
jgi:hypothetical protein